MTITELIDRVRREARARTLAVAAPYDAVTLKSAHDAFTAGIARVILFGDRSRIAACAGTEGIPLEGMELRDIAETDKVLAAAVAAANEGAAQMLMKGDVPTSKLMHAVLNGHTGIVPEGRLVSHVGVFHAPAYDRMMLITDAGININPDFERKVQIIRNAITVAHRLGVARPRVALLAAIETVNVGKMPVTVEARLIAKMGQAGLLGEAFVDGPFALDNAVSAEAARLKNLGGEVAGRADILVAPDIEAGNVLYKAITTFAGLTFASVVVGARVPIVMPSRVDSEQTKLASIALAAYISGKE
ncbi:MAG: bifunctional enoyl-CoA hydratase/phosphate acetyltransferase [Planctomycetota bacterium]